jgi:hypothetical protein
LRGAAPLKDNSYVAANLAIAYAKAGFIQDARENVQNVAVNEQQEDIVRAAYRNISDQLEHEKDIIGKLERLIELEKHIVYDAGLAQLNVSQDELLRRFVGEWEGPSNTLLSIDEENNELRCKLRVENEYYEHASYKIKTRYEPGILQLDATLDETTLKERATASRATARAGLGAFGGIGGIGNALTTSTLLSSAFNLPSEVCLFVLVPGEGGSLVGVLATGSRSALGEKEKTLLNAKQVNLNRSVAVAMTAASSGEAPPK